MWNGDFKTKGNEIKKFVLLPQNNIRNQSRVGKQNCKCSNCNSFVTSLSASDHYARNYMTHNFHEEIKNTIKRK